MWSPQPDSLLLPHEQVNSPSSADFIFTEELVPPEPETSTLYQQDCVHPQSHAEFKEQVFIMQKSKFVLSNYLIKQFMISLRNSTSPWSQGMRLTCMERIWKQVNITFQELVWQKRGQADEILSLERISC